MKGLKTYRKFLQFGIQERFQLVLETVSSILLVILTCMSVWAKDWQHAAIFFCLATIVTTLAEKRLHLFFGGNTIETIDSKDRLEAFTQLTAAPREWVFRGGSGRWFRNSAIPAVAKTAKTKSNIRALLVDPRDEVACKNYADYRRKSSWYSDHTVEGRGIQAEVLATIFILCRAHNDQRLIVQTSLTSAYSPLRIDANGDSMIVTTPDRQIKPLKLTSEHWMYHAFVDEVNEAAIGGSLLIWPQWHSGSGELSLSQVKSTLSQVAVLCKRTTSQSPLLSGFSSESDVDWSVVWQAVSTSHNVERVG